MPFHGWTAVSLKSKSKRPMLADSPMKFPLSNP